MIRRIFLKLEKVLGLCSSETRAEIAFLLSLNYLFARNIWGELLDKAFIFLEGFIL